jgi:hypothetical protein
MDIQQRKGEVLKIDFGDYTRRYQRMRCLVCKAVFLYWYDARKLRGKQLKLPEIDSVEWAGPLTDEEKLRRWLQ